MPALPEGNVRMSSYSSRDEQGERRVGMSGGGLQGKYRGRCLLLFKETAENKKLVLLKNMLVSATFTHPCSKERFLYLPSLCNTPLKSLLMYIIAF